MEETDDRESLYKKMYVYEKTGRVNHSKKCLPRTKCLTGEDEGEKPKEIIVIDPDTEVCISHQILCRY
jgi:hypothetical protein